MGTSAAIIENSGGALGYSCLHNGCADKHWADLRELFEPEYKLTRERFSEANSQSDSQSHHSSTKAQKVEPLGRRAADIKPEPVEWLVEDAIPCGKLTLIAGDPGSCKTTLGMALAATISCGGTAFNGTPCKQGPVLILSAEDGAADTLVPRLIAAGADLNQIQVADVTQLLSLPDEIEKIEKTVRHNGARLVILDPLNSYLDGINPHQDASVRQALAPLASAAQSTGAAFVVIFHLNKDGGKEGKQALYRPTGSIGFVAASRAAFVMAADPADEGRRVLASLKFNLGPKPKSWAFVVREKEIADRSIVAAYLECVGESPLNADQLLGRGRDANGEPELDRAIKLIRDMLMSGPKSVPDIEAALTLSQITDRTARRAYGALKVHSYKVTFRGVWYKALPGDPACCCRPCRKAAQASEGRKGRKGNEPREDGQDVQPPARMANFVENPTERGTSTNLTVGQLRDDPKSANDPSKSANGQLRETPTERTTSSEVGQTYRGVDGDGQLRAEGSVATEKARNREAIEKVEIDRLAAADTDIDGEEI